MPTSSTRRASGGNGSYGRASRPESVWSQPSQFSSPLLPGPYTHPIAAVEYSLFTRDVKRRTVQ
jgi:hypothetical protein